MILKALTLLLISTSAFAADLKILSWNIFMLPKPIKFSLQEIRSKVIPEQLSGSDYDLMFFQEAFTGDIQNKLKAKLKKDYPYSYYLKNYTIIYPYFGSGTFVMSRYPFKVLDRVYYKKCGAADCYAAKGAALIETTLPSGKVVQFANTHLQSTESLGAVRLSQLQQVKGMLKKHQRPGVPQIIMGDLNIDSIEPEFQQGLDIMEMNFTNLEGPILHTNARVNDCYKNPGKNKEWIDHFWISNETRLKHSAMQVRVFDFEHKGRLCPTSDHHAVEAIFTFES